MVNFRNAVIVMTSNVGTSFVKKSGALGFVGMAAAEKENHKRIEEALKQTFRPEFINRIDEIIIFEPLSEEDVVEIVKLQVKDVQLRLAEQGNLSIEPVSYTHLDVYKRQCLCYIERIMRCVMVPAAMRGFRGWVMNDRCV